MMQRSIPRSLASVAAVVAGCAALAGSASAHVTIPEPATKGGFGIVTLSVPNERDDAGTITLEVQLPTDHGLPFVSVQPKPGWSVTTTTRTLDEPVEAFGEEHTEVVDTVTWTGGPIEPGQFDTFSLSVGPLPDDVDNLVFPAIQTYSSGEEVAWIEVAAEGGEQPEHPAPVLTLVDGEAATAATVEDGDDGSDGVGVAALVVAIVAALLGGAGLLTARRRAA